MALAPAAWAILLVVLLWWGPGWLFGEALGVRRVLLPAAAPVIGLGLLSAVGSLGAVVGLPWTLPWVLVACLALSAVALVVRLTVSRRWGRSGGQPTAQHSTQRTTQSSEPRAVWWRYGVAGLVPAAVVGAVTWLHGTSGLTTVNQDWDIPWHANMVRLIADSHQWNPHLAGHLAYYDTTMATAPIRSYPIALHAALALVWPASGISIPALINVFTLVLVAVQLPLSTMALTALVLRSPVAVAAAGAASAWVTAYPYDLLWRGPLIPFFAGMVLVGPFVLLAATTAVRRHWAALPAVATAGVAVMAVHPSLAFVAVPILGCWLLNEVVRSRRRAVGTAGYLTAAGLLSAVLGVVVIREMVQEAGRVSRISWPPDASLPGAIRNLMVLSHAALPLYVVPVLGIVAVVGLAIGARRSLWYLAPVLIFGSLAIYTMSSTAPAPPFTAPFYDDQWRFFAVYAMLVVPLLGIGVHYVAALLGSRLGRVRPAAATGTARWAAVSGPGGRVAVAGVAVLAAAGVVTSPVIGVNEVRLSWSNKVSGRTLSSDDIALMSSLSRWVPPSATILNNACDGSVWMYALGGRMPMIRHFEILPTQRQALLLNDFGKLATDARVRSAAAELGVEWVYVEEGRIRTWDKPPAGLEHLDQRSFLTRVARVGHAALYRVDWDRLPGGRAQLDRDASTRVQEPGVPGTWGSTTPSPLASRSNVC